MMCTLLIVFVVLLSLTKLSPAVPIAEFYPFGGSHGDSDFPKNDDGSSPEITISTLFPFFNNQHDSLYVNTNGVISFLGTLSQFTPYAFPLNNDRRLIAPFWADVDITNGGTVWYRETTNASILERATHDVRLYYPGQPGFVAAWVFIATWDDVAFFGAGTAIAAKVKKRNSFQAVLITNGRHSFTIFNYYNITWTTGTASGGDSLEGLGGTPAQVGFNAGDGVNYYAVNESRTDAIINLPRLSNVHMDGKFVFRIDSETIEQGGCNTGGTLTMSPRYSHMFGGEEKVLAGPCIQSNDSVTAVFGTGGSSINCIMHSMFSVACVTPMFYTTGDVSVILTVTSSNQQSTIYEGRITILNPLNTKPILQRLDPSNWRRGEQVTVKWSAEDIPFDIEGSTVDIYAVKLDSNHIPRIQYFSSVVQYVESIQSEASFTFESEDDVTILCLVEVTQDNDQHPKQRVWSEVFAVIPGSIDESKTSCNLWQTMDDQLPPLSGIQVQVCPCRLDQVEIDFIRFHPDPGCQSSDSSDVSANCLFHPHAKQCFRLNTPGPTGTGQLCCYDNNGNAMSVVTSSGGGSLQRFHYFGDTDVAVPYLSNFVFDTAPYYLCCVYPQLNQSDVSSECFGFYQRRAPGNCNDYVPNTPAQNFGDPHFVTPDGLSYTFNGAGEFILFRTTTNTFIAQVRMQPLANNVNTGNQGSVITSFAAEAVNTSDRVEVRLNSIRAFDILVNGVIQDITGVPFLRYKGLTISVRDNPSTTNDHKKQVNLAFPEQAIAFLILVYESFLNYVVSFGPGVKRGGIEGLLGNFNQDANDDLVSQTGNVLLANSSTEDIHNNMGESWRITEEESLFTYAVGTSYASNQDRNFSPPFDVPVSAVDNTTRELCGNDTFCYYDYYVTRDTTLARSTRTSAHTLTRIKEISRKTVTCGFPRAVEYGQWNISGIEVGDTGKLLCNSDAQLQGSGYITCNTEGHWTNDHSSCAPSVVKATIDPNTEKPTSDSWLVLVVIGVTSVFVLIIIILAFIVLVRCFCCKNSKAKGRGDREYPKSTQEHDNPMFKSSRY